MLESPFTSILRHLRLKKVQYHFEPFVYINQIGDVSSGMTNRVKWLKKFYINEYSYKRAEKKAFERLSDTYPEYKGHIWLF